MLPLPGVANPLVQQANRWPGGEGRQINALLIQRLHHRAEALAGNASDDGLFRDLAVLQEHLADGRPLLAHLWGGSTGGEPGVTPLNQEGRNAAAPPVPIVRASQHGKEIGHRCQGDVMLMAVQYVVPIPRGHGPGFQRRGVGTRLRFRERQAADQLARRQAGQIAFLLRLRTVAHQTLRADARVLRPHHPVGHGALGQLDKGERQLFTRQTATAVGFGDTPTKGAQFPHSGDRLLGHRILRLHPVLIRNRHGAHKVARGVEQLV